MEIRLRRELEELTKQDVQRGSYESVDEFVEQAVSMLHEQEAWLAANRAEIQKKIAEGYASAQRLLAGCCWVSLVAEFREKRFFLHLIAAA